MEVSQLTDGVLELPLCDDSSDMEIDWTEVDNDAPHGNIQISNKENISTTTDEPQSEAGVNIISSMQCLSYKIVGDNLDTKIKPCQMRKDRQSRMLNYFHSYSVKSRITPPESMQSEQPPSAGEFLCLALEDILPSSEDKSQILSNYCILLSRVLCKHIPYFYKLSSCVPKHIEHQFSEEMSKKSEVVC